MRLTRPVTRKICGGDVGDGFRVDADDLRPLVLIIWYDLG
jgi:hypothetical protein